LTIQLLVVLGRWLSNPSSPLERALKAYRKLNISLVSSHAARPVVKRAKWLNATELAQVVERYQAGATTYELAEQFDIGRELVPLACPPLTNGSPALPDRGLSRKK
jgi:hypothetical protein